MKQIHRPGGNYFNDMRIDYNVAFDNFEELNRNFRGHEREKDIRHSYLHNILKKLKDIKLLRTGKMESLVLTGIRREWFEEFLAFWGTVLGGASA